MFCPKCGQQQIADYTKFCSRCGLAISGLGEYVAGGASLTLHKGTQALAVNSPKSIVTRRGAKVMFLSAVLGPLFFGLCFLADSPGPLLVPLSIFLAGLSWILYAQLFGEATAPAANQPSQPSQLGAVPGAAALTQAAKLQLNSGRGQGGTAEMVSPPSVTEHTTRLLDGGEA